MRRPPAWLSLALLATPLAAQEGPVNRIHYPLSEELETVLRAADAAREAGRWEQAVVLYRSALGEDLAADGAGYRVARWGDEEGQRRFRGVSQWAIEGLRRLPPPGLAVFRRMFDVQAAAWRDRAAVDRDPGRALARVYELFPVASCSAGMLEAMGDLALERGDLARAGRAYAGLLAHHAAELPDRGRIERKQAMSQLGLLHPDRQRALSRQVGMARVDATNRARLDLHLAPGKAAFAPRPFIDGGSDRGAPLHLPLTDGRTAFLIGTERIRAFDLASGQEAREIPRLSRHTWVEVGAKSQLSGALVRGTLIAPQVETVLDDQSFRGIPVKVRRPVRKLAGFDLEGWRWRWEHARSLRGTAREGWSWPTPPVCADGVAFASAYEVRGFVNSHATAVDAVTGELLWSTWVASGQVEQTMFGEQATEPLCLPMAAEDGSVFHVSCLGSLTALDEETGRTLWIAEYQQIEVHAPRGFYADHRAIGWESNAPLVEAGVVVAAPLDSDWCYAFEAASGQRLWRERRRQLAVGSDLRWVFGAAEGRVVLAGDQEVRCLDVRTGKRLWARTLESETVVGRGLLVRDAVCVPIEGGVLLLDLRTGAPGRRFALSASGNLALTSERLLAAGAGTLAVHTNLPPAAR